MDHAASALAPICDVTPESRKRKPGSGALPAASQPNMLRELREVRLHPSTMLYTSQEVDSEIHEFGLHHALARSLLTKNEACCGSASSRVLQMKARVALQLLLYEGGQNSGVPPSMQKELLEEASARSLDGILLDSQVVVLLQASDQTVLIDNDKQDGVSQQLLTDMFTRMSLR